MPEMKVPGPDHPITLAADPRRLQVVYNGHVIADTRDALTLKEATYKAVAYFPRDDVAMEFFSRTDRETYCPYKGYAHYYTILMDGDFADNAVWTYEEPYPAMEAIRDRVAFYPHFVEIHAVGEVETPQIRQAILHTDDGAGASQKDRWRPNVDEALDL